MHWSGSTPRSHNFAILQIVNVRGAHDCASCIWGNHSWSSTLCRYYTVCVYYTFSIWVCYMRPFHLQLQSLQPVLCSAGSGQVVMLLISQYYVYVRTYVIGDCDGGCVGLLIIQWILSGITAGSPMVGTPINQVQTLINQGLIKDLLSVDLWNGERAGKKGGGARSQTQGLWLSVPVLYHWATAPTSNHLSFLPLCSLL